mmetsp:Transcript_28316/g.81260  ORF Transcript_28316/g.81260 Transcript_28316/m.81260 type:complete len:595 (-) Transcript_28316:64-1848(-)
MSEAAPSPDAQPQADGAAAAGAGAEPPPKPIAPGASPSNGAAGGELMPFDDGSMTADKAQSSAMNLVINYAEPFMAAGTAVFGLGLIVLPLLARLNTLDEDSTFKYARHGETNPKQPMRLFTESEMRQRLGLLDAESVAEEITMTTNELDDHMEGCEMDATDDEVSKMQKWRDSANAHLKGLQKRSALAFLGLPPEATDNDINKMYKKMALELHPDKGGDPEKFQELQEMKERLNEAEKEDGEKKKDDEDPEDEEAKKAKEKEKEEEEEGPKLPPNERIKKLRMDVHDNCVRLWERAKKSRDEITGDKSIRCNSQPAMNILRMFVDRFVNNEIKTLRHDDTKGAEAKFRKFVKQGAEIIAVAAMQDVQGTLSTVAMHFNYRLVARSGSADIKSRCTALLEAISEVPTQSEAFIKRVEDSLATAKDREKARKEAKAKEQAEREARGDLGGEQGSAGAPKAAGPAKAGAEAKAPAAKAKAAGAAKAFDPFGDFDFEEKKGAPPKAPAPKAPASPSAALAKKKEDERSAIAAAQQQQRRTGWDPNFDHPYAGALKSNGTGVYCRPCQRWIMTYEYSTEVFLTHVERVHPKPPPGWTG